MKFSQFLIEEKAVEKLSHLDHVEDHILTDGQEGYNRALGSLRATFDKMTGKPEASKLTTKYDGSPSIVFGYHPKENRFFVGTKSVFNKNPKLNYTPEDINKNHDDPGLRGKLKKALEYLPKVAPLDGIYQGDLMYTNDSVDEDTRQYHFTPNTLMYSIKKTDPEGLKIKKAKIGLVVHTKYHGKDFDAMKAGFDVDRHMFNKNADVHLMDPEVNFEKTIGDQDVHNDFALHMQNAENQFADLHPDAFGAISPHAANLKRYVNQTVRTGDKPTAVGFKAYMIDQNEKDSEKLSSDAGKLKKKEQLIDHIGYVDDNHEHYQNVFNLHNYLQQAKDTLVNALADSTPYENSVNGEETKPEGFVITYKGFPSKLVDRAEFSKANFKKNDKKS